MKDYYLGCHTLCLGLTASLFLRVTELIPQALVSVNPTPSASFIHCSGSENNMCIFSYVPTVIVTNSFMTHQVMNDFFNLNEN